jgi:hypothetical protein
MREYPSSEEGQCLWVGLAGSEALPCEDEVVSGGGESQLELLSHFARGDGLEEWSVLLDEFPEVLLVGDDGGGPERDRVIAGEVQVLVEPEAVGEQGVGREPLGA